MAKKVVVIGAGIAGLVATKYCKQQGLDVTCYEKTNNIGGTWVYTDATGLDKHGLNIHSSMYKNLHTNLPKEVMGFQDFDFTGPDASFVKPTDVMTFLEEYSAHFDLKRYIKFEHLVTDVRPVDGDKWRVEVKNLVHGTRSNDTYDSVFVCNGHYSVPSIPNIEGIENFKGEVMHSHNYRRPESFKDKTVLTIGAGPSGVDITFDLSSHAKQVYWSHHLPSQVRNYYPETVTQKPDVAQVLQDGRIHFYDGSVASVDVILFCTGYHYTFPFLSPECEIKVTDNHVTTLYKHVVNINHPTMYIIGLPFSTLITLLFDLQVRYCLKFLTGDKTLPSKSDMLADYERDVYERKMRGLPNRKMHLLGNDRVRKYYEDLTNAAEIEPIKPVILDIYFRTGYLRVNDVKNYRRYKYRVVDDYNFIEYL